MKTVDYSLTLSRSRYFQHIRIVNLMLVMMARLSATFVSDFL